MKRTFAFGLISLLALAEVRAQQHTQTQIDYDGTTGEITFSWWGEPGQTYFIQHTEDLMSWLYFVDIRPGADAPEGFGLNATNADRIFFRLRYTDQPTDDPHNSDFDGDGVSNMDELHAGLDPLSNLDLDNDGLPDDWERFRFSGSLARDGTGTDDGDEFTDAEEFKFGLDPTADDSVTSAKDLSYDALGRLQTAGSMIYSYDEEGNLQTVAP